MTFPAVDFAARSERSCGVAKPTHPKSTRDSSTIKTAAKSLAYEALFAVNENLDQVLQRLDRLHRMDLFDSRFWLESRQAWRATIEETRAWINFETVACLQEQEQRDWARFGHLRHRLEKRGQDPNDALVTAARLARKSTRKQRRK